MKSSFKLFSLYFLAVITLISGGLIIAGTNITNTDVPTPTMYTINDIYALIDTTPTSGASLSPFEPVGSSMHSVSELYVKLANLINSASTTVTYLGVSPTSTPTLVTAITKEFNPSTQAGTITGFTLDDIYNLITENTRPLTPNHTFSPSSAPTTGTMHSLTEIYTSLSGLIQSGDIAAGTTYIGVPGTYELPELCSDGPTDPDCWSAEVSKIWDTTNYVNTAVTETTNTYDGKANTTILHNLGIAYEAAEYCYTLHEGSVPDGTWYLPSYAELWAGYGALGLGGFPSNIYWSSTEGSNGPDLIAWGLDTDYDGMNGGGKGSRFFVRCLRNGTYVPPTTYTVVFDAQGGTPDFSTTTDILSGATITPPTEPTKDGFTFSGWYTEPNGAGTVFNASTAVEVSITVYAKWVVADACSHTATDQDCWSADLGQMNWSNEYVITGAQSINDGRENTNNLASRGSGYAAYSCATLSEGGHSDWYLPASQELVDAGDAGIQGFQSYDYWSSTEYFNPAEYDSGSPDINARVVYAGGINTNHWEKIHSNGNIIFVRCLR